ncbi:unnamed protein product [Amoebophrya sp. A25]|nr:unnamed protein product [Amoebophrya sp. A25]|eukprot:GSA25T00014240001.1
MCNYLERADVVKNRILGQMATSSEKMCRIMSKNEGIEDDIARGDALLTEMEPGRCEAAVGAVYDQLNPSNVMWSAVGGGGINTNSNIMNNIYAYGNNEANDGNGSGSGCQSSTRSCFDTANLPFGLCGASKTSPAAIPDEQNQSANLQDSSSSSGSNGRGGLLGKKTDDFTTLLQNKEVKYVPGQAMKIYTLSLLEEQMKCAGGGSSASSPSVIDAGKNMNDTSEEREGQHRAFEFVTLPINHQGWLQKRGRYFWNGMRPRYAVLFGNTLAYGESPWHCATRKFLGKIVLDPKSKIVYDDRSASGSPARDDQEISISSNESKGNANQRGSSSPSGHKGNETGPFSIEVRGLDYFELEPDLDEFDEGKTQEVGSSSKTAASSSKKRSAKTKSRKSSPRCRSWWFQADDAVVAQKWVSHLRAARHFAENLQRHGAFRWRSTLQGSTMKNGQYNYANTYGRDGVTSSPPSSSTTMPGERGNRLTALLGNQQNQVASGYQYQNRQHVLDNRSSTSTTSKEEQRWDRLESLLDGLQSGAQLIGDEARKQNSMLKTMNSSLTTADRKLDAQKGRMKTLMR